MASFLNALIFSSKNLRSETTHSKMTTFQFLSVITNSDYAPRRPWYVQISQALQSPLQKTRPQYLNFQKNYYTSVP